MPGSISNDTPSRAGLRGTSGRSAAAPLAGAAGRSRGSAMLEYIRPLGMPPAVPNEETQDELLEPPVRPIPPEEPRPLPRPPPRPPPNPSAIAVASASDWPGASARPGGGDG